MEKIVTIEGQEIRLKTHGNVPDLYKKHFGTDFFTDMNSMSKGGMNVSVLNNVLWLSAKIADPEIPPIDNWNESFDSFPILSAIDEVQEMLGKLMNTGKKMTTPRKVAKSK
ncbi:hypothetical protein ACIQ2D_08630 [Lysinibacillus sp. NPDC097287]|uniref:hypothetical protein n=1 Tax=Lysinibacillus sp. NPDC097287 TaxID=3364144 RepID=UPI00382942E3